MTASHLSGAALRIYARPQGDLQSPLRHGVSRHDSQQYRITVLLARMRRSLALPWTPSRLDIITMLVGQGPCPRFMAAGSSNLVSAP